MGLLVHTTFTTAQGIPIQSVYVSLRSFNYEIRDKLVLYAYAAHLSRDMRNQSFQSIEVPRLGNGHTTTSETIPTLEFLYLKLARLLVSNGFSVEDVLEDGQTVTLVLPPEPEPVPSAPPPNPDPVMPPAPAPSEEAPVVE